MSSRHHAQCTHTQSHEGCDKHLILPWNRIECSQVHLKRKSPISNWKFALCYKQTWL